jgi:predicted RNA methylase
MAKIPFDKYYTPPTVARWCIEKTYEIIGKDNITEIVEPSAGCGMFSHQISGCKAYDLYPQHEYIEQADFLKLDLGYKKGRLFIGNPPFGGNSGKLLTDFYKKCCKEGDYIAFIQPASYYNNYNRNNIFEIVYSCLIETPYTNENLKTSFTIYKNNPDKKNWKEKEFELSDVTIYEYHRTNKKDEFSKRNSRNMKVTDYDYSFVRYGDILSPAKPFEKAGVIAIKCNNEINKKDIIEFFKWLYDYNKRTKILNKKSISSAALTRKDVKQLLRICIPNIK